MVGGGGFIGGYVVAALRDAGWQVRCVVRQPRGPEDVHGDLMQLVTPADWFPYLDGVELVVNAAGILRETAGQRFEPVHVAAPLALAEACGARGIRRFVQVSALGDPGDGEFVASKHRADARLLGMGGLDAVVLRPSVVYATGGSYGGTSLLRALAGFPGVLPLPGDGRWLIQPVAAEDLAKVVCLAASASDTGVFDVAGPEPITLRGYLHAWRDWLRIAPARDLRIPENLVAALVAVAERLGKGPLSRATWRMLRSGNIADASAGPRLLAAFGFAPRAMGKVLARTPSQVQDRWHARLTLLEPVLHVGVIVLFLLSAIAGFATPQAQIEQLAGDSVLLPMAPALARGGAVFDLVLGLLLLVGWKQRYVIAAMALLVLAYTVILGTTVPSLWLDPLGGMAKNLVVVPALGVLWILADRR